MKKIISFAAAAALVAFLAYGVTYHRKEIPAEKPGRMIATPAFGKYFGGVPPCDKGTAYAFVIYFPSGKEKGKVVPFPFFTFDEGSMKKVAIERLLAGMEIGSYRGEFVSVPAGSRLLSLDEARGTVTANFSKELDASAETGVPQAIALTLRQFKGVSEIRLQTEGKDSPLSVPAKNAGDGAVQEPSPPRLLSVTAMRDKGATRIEDLNAFFDRPVEIKELRLLNMDGRQFEGELFHSVFDMAAVLKPKDPSQFTERMPIKVRWKVVDKLGRQAQGEDVWPLEVKEH